MSHAHGTPKEITGETAAAIAIAAGVPAKFYGRCEGGRYVFTIETDPCSVVRDGDTFKVFTRPERAG